MDWNTYFLDASTKHSKSHKEPRRQEQLSKQGPTTTTPVCLEKQLVLCLFHKMECKNEQFFPSCSFIWEPDLLRRNWLWWQWSLLWLGCYFNKMGKCLKLFTGIWNLWCCGSWLQVVGAAVKLVPGFTNPFSRLWFTSPHLWWLHPKHNAL